MSHKYLFASSLLFLILIINSCIKEIPFENNKTFGKISISGQFTNRAETGDPLQDNDYQIVEIRQVPNENSASQANGDPIENAIVEVIDDLGQIFEFTYIGQGKYRTNGVGEIGRSYQLKVTTGDHVFESSSHPILTNAPIDSLRAEVRTSQIITSNGSVSSKKVVDLVLNTKLFDGINPLNALYRLKGEHQFMEVDNRIAPFLRTCYIKQNFDFGTINSYSGEDYPDNQLREIVLYTTDHDYRFAMSFSYLVDQYVVDQPTINYWNTIKKITSTKQSLFDPPPGRFENNIKCTSHPDDTPLGYFTVGSINSKRIFTSSLKMGENMVIFCTGGGFRKKAECVDCRLFTNSTDMRPPYWIN